MNCEECNNKIREDKYKVKRQSDGVVLGGFIMEALCDKCEENRESKRRCAEIAFIRSEFSPWYEEYHKKLFGRETIYIEEIIADFIIDNNYSKERG